MMTEYYKIKVVTDFAAAHHLRDYPGECSRTHGHNWKIEIEVNASSLDHLGMAVDFKQVKSAAQLILKEYDHRYLNEISPFDQTNPTAENIAAHLFRCLASVLNDSRTKVSCVTVWETERACASYYEEVPR